MKNRTTPQTARYTFGAARSDDAGRTAPAYEPLADGEPALAACEPWDEQDRADFFEAEYRDSLRESGGGW